MEQWRVWCADGSVYDSARHGWADVPDDGLVLRMIYEGAGCRSLHQGYDYYFDAPSPQGVVHGASNDSPDEIARRYPGAVVKRGQWVNGDFYAAVVEAAMALLQPPAAEP